LSLAEQLKAAQSLLKPVDRVSLSESQSKQDAMKRESILTNRTDQISQLAAQIAAAVKAKEKKRKHNSSSESSNSDSYDSEDDSD
jgi:outer membrane PBP1 activator LpoA protein